jgi:hypothetical protein
MFAPYVTGVLLFRRAAHALDLVVRIVVELTVDFGGIGDPPLSRIVPARSRWDRLFASSSRLFDILRS